MEVRPGGSGREVSVSWESIQGMEHVCMHYITILSTPANKQGMSSSLSESHSQNGLPPALVNDRKIFSSLFCNCRSRARRLRKATPRIAFLTVINFLTICFAKKRNCHDS